MNFPVSIKGVLFEAGRVVLLENERGEWELRGGRLESEEASETCLAVNSPKNWVRGRSRHAHRLLALRGSN
jgi:hypothetical protein